MQMIKSMTNDIFKEYFGHNKTSFQVKDLYTAIKVKNEQRVSQTNYTLNDF